MATLDLFIYSLLSSLQSYFLSTSSISITTLQGMDCSLTDNEGRHIQKTQIAHLRFVTGLGLDLKSPTLMQLPETDTSQPIQLQLRRQSGKCLTKSEALRAFFRLAIQSRFLPLHPICSLEVFLSQSLQLLWDHTQVTVNIPECLPLLTWGMLCPR